MTRVFIARHAEPERSKDVPQTNWPLSRFGRNQADELAELLQDFAPLNIVSAPSRRCQETAEFAAKRLGKSVKTDPRLGEVVPPKGTAEYEAWLAQNFQIDVTWTQLDANLNKWRNETVQAVAELTENTVVFTHFTNVNAIMAAALKLENTLVCRPDYASITEFAVLNGDIRMVMYGTEIKGSNE